MTEEIAIKTGKDLLNEESAKDNADTLNLVQKYIQTIPISLSSVEEYEAEKEWALMQIKKEKLLNYIKQKVLKPDDYQQISAKKFIKKSGVRRLMSAFGISISKVNVLNVMEKDWESAPPEYVHQIGSKKEIIIIVQATAQKKTTISKNGQTFSVVQQEMVATASYSSREAFEKHQPYKFHNILSTAETRAKSRAALDMLSGDVSMEEVLFDEKDSNNTAPNITNNKKNNYQEG
jgi:hypothetical protein